jgi:hypothetical protein
MSLDLPTTNQFGGAGAVTLISQGVGRVLAYLAALVVGQS